MKIKRKLAGFCGGMAALALCGCSLAVPDASEDSEGDHLIGAFITSEYLDLYDMEAYLNDQVSKIINEKEVTVTNSKGYEQKLYATIEKGSSGNPSEWKVSFGDVEGINFFSPLWTNKDGEPCWESVYDDGISEVNISLNTSDTEEEHNITGTIYVMNGKSRENNIYYTNPVYQTPKGDIYVRSGDGCQIDVEYEEGENLTTTLNDELKTTENGKTIVNKSNVTLHIVTLQKPVKITVYQMNQEHVAIKKEEYKPGEMPEKISAEQGTAYVLVEMEQENLLGENVISRDIYDYDKAKETIIETFYALDDKIVSKQKTEFR